MAHVIPQILLSKIIPTPHRLIPLLIPAPPPFVPCRRTARTTPN